MNLLAAHTDGGDRLVHGGAPVSPQPGHHRGAHERERHGRLGGGTLAGLGHLLRFMLRRDRLWLPIWVLALSALTAYFANAIAVVMDSDSLQAMTAFAKNPVMALITGPGYGLDQVTIPRFIVGMYGVFLMIGAALMSILTVSRHTRTEEQTGRAELVRAGVTGRHTQLVAALVLTVFMNLLLSAGMAAAFGLSQAEPDSWSATVLFTVGIGAVGCVFAAVTAVTVQLSAFARAASSMAGAVLALSFVLRGIGDMSHVSGGSLDWLSWLSPLGWAQQTAPFTLDRWWPLLYSVGLFMALVVAAAMLQSRRDLGAGIVAERLGRSQAGPLLSTPLGLALRLQASNLIWWSMSMLVMGVVFGSFTGPMDEGAAGMPPEILSIMGGRSGIVDGYLGYMALYFAIIVAAYAVIAAGGVRSEEASFHTEPVLATAVSRGGWLGSWAAVTLLGAGWLMAMAGLGEGVGAAMSMDDWSLLWPTLVGHLAQTPSIWALLGFAYLLYGFVPRLMSLSWIVFGASAVLALFGGLMQLDDVVLDLSLFTHIGQYPAQDLSAEAVAWFVGITAVLVGAGMVGFRRRDLVTA
ncbi:ABC-2 type transport system permease protein [Brevibacterium siliguriense]|uniref:ABC-2 type transport system permease protein n=1 Tax=Brevibacterium siliguriense TaxID=1136497 RepID=A0A1H1NVK9_9MICO|nr:ABC transporter permease [Brevibacterium siliguriense]SDS02399.1 ABC-2 type transport system permease protein [Brevibacterium siliguriense]